ncbi:ligand-binding sensor domain-containing protein [Marinoscillum furvescens]|uniref:histidine kinase n=1 Tax=Marinoscillum furvescens DSM 4134 TaxID=1122208 RepID=A0A3D9L3P0_MARFU|nr:two-component regulator propeller domain-containing protein [Marinoscillum furvescens]RED96978.1 two component regulator with propeller domain [Marinoscillum furvescens DSM 4134]
MRLLFFVLACVGQLCLYAQPRLNGNLDHLSVPHGLSHGTVHSIVQDPEDIMWFGTTNGLNAYNGYDFKVFRSDEHDSTSISGDFVTKLVVKSQDELWVATHSGLNLYNKLNDAFVHIPQSATEPGYLSNGTIKDLVIDGQYLWVATAWGLNRIQNSPPYHTLSRYFYDEKRPNSLSDNHINCLMKDGDLLWIGTNKGVNILSLRTGEFVHHHRKGLHKDELTGPLVTNIYKDSKGQYWIATETGLNRYDWASDKVRRFYSNAYSPGVQVVRQVYEDSFGDLWVATDGGGILHYDQEGDRFTANKKNIYSPKSLSSNAIYTLYEAKGNILWIGTYERGVHDYHRRKSLFHTYSHDPFANSLSYGGVKSAVLSKHRNGIWIGTNADGVNFFDLGTGQFSVYRHEPNNPNSISSNIVKSILETENGNLWIGCYTGGLNYFQPEAGLNVNYPVIPPNAELSSTHIWNLYRDSNDELWVGTLRGGLVQFDPKANSYRHFIHKPLDTSTIASNLISVIFEDSRGNFWVGNEEESGGLNLMNREEGTFQRFVHKSEDSTSISHNFVREIYEDSKGNLWVGTSGGLNRLDYETFTFERYHHLGPYFSGIINDVLEDDQGYLWISTNQGILRFDPSTENYIYFDSRDGLQGDEFSYNTALKLEDGRLFFGGIEGFNLFDPEKIIDTEPSPTVVITGFQLDDQEMSRVPLLDQKIRQGTQVVLEPHESAFSIQFAAINYHTPGKINYAYRLAGMEDNWRYVGNERRATYTNLDPGLYTFYVKASNSFGEWGDNVQKLNIRILPAWYDNILFRIGVAIMLLGVLVGIYQYRTKSLSRKRRLLQRMVEERTSEIENLNKELANSNEILQGTNQKLMNQRNELEKIVEELNVTRDKLIVSEKMASIGVFTAGIAHEINNPINYIAGATRLLTDLVDKQIAREDSKFSEEELASILELENTIKVGVEKTSSIIQSLRNYVHEDGGTFKLYNCIYCIEDALKILRSAYKGRIEIVKNYPEKLIIECMPGRINQVIINLISNAIDAIPEEGTIRIDAYAEGQEVILKIRDTGVGIPLDLMAKLYDPFFTTKDVGKGMGLGLYIVYGIISKHHGKISVHTEEGKGTEFTIELPMRHSDNAMPQMEVIRKNDAVT